MAMPGKAASIRVWDWPVRLCHWGFALIIPAMWWTAEYGEMAWHKRLGILLIFLLAFRILWGFVGSSTARFRSFLKGPVAVWRYLRNVGDDQDAQPLGHNPAGGWSAVILLAAMALQSVTGLFAGDPFDGSTGPLNEKVGVLTADLLTDWHEDFFYVLAGFALLHVLAIVFYLVVKRTDLIGPMITGRARARGPDQCSSMVAASAAAMILSLALSAAIALWLWLGGPGL